MRRVMVGMLAVTLLAAGRGRGQVGPAAALEEWSVEGQRRQAIVIPPAVKSDAAPVMLVFHGHGGTGRLMEAKGFHRHWPEAVTVYPQGLPTVTPNDPDGGRAGWQLKAGDYNDRDLRFVEAILKTLREKYRVDDRRVYATGHSNGGAFTYLLWARKAKVLAAIAPSSAPGGALLQRTADFRPVPVLHLGSEADRVVPFVSQAVTMRAVREILGCSGEGKPWAKAGELVGTEFASPGGTPFVKVLHPGGHRFPDEAAGLIVRFFKEHPGK